MGVPRAKIVEVLKLIFDGAKSLRLVREIKGKYYVDLGAKQTPGVETSTSENQVSSVDIEESPPLLAESVESPLIVTKTPVNDATDKGLTKRVFITHGRNTAFIEPIKKLLGFGELIPVVSVENQSVSKPVPDKVMDDMRSCGAAIIHVDAERSLLDQEANEHVILNQNVVMEIGAAMALYGRRFILLVKDGVALPSNLQGLYQVRYSGDSLDGPATIHLLEAINDIKNHPIPTRNAKSKEAK